MKIQELINKPIPRRTVFKLGLGAGLSYLSSGCYAVSKDGLEAPFGEYLVGGEIIIN